ncbi:MAG: hypothetical protein K2W96_11880 [Gemmataceae bacterium]|nr:hypothetical protein [Gemmataceae bacterium]
MDWYVEWERTAVDFLHELIAGAPDGPELVATALRINATIKADAENAGESRRRRLRILIDSPLAVYSTFEPLSRTAVVREVWRATRPRP